MNADRGGSNEKTVVLSELPVSLGDLNQIRIFRIVNLT